LGQRQGNGGADFEADLNQISEPEIERVGGGDIRAAFVRRRSRQHSAVTNGKRLFVDGGDGRGPWARRLRDVIALHVADQGGIDAISEAKCSLIRRAGALTVELERIEAKFATSAAGENDFGTYVTGTNSLRRVLEAIGLHRVARDVTPDLRTYLAEPAP
jgi:hypothetical protein